MRGSYPQAVLLVVVLCLIAGLFWGVSTSGGTFDPYNNDWDGTSDLRTGVTDEAEVVVARSATAYGRVPSSQTAAVVLEPSERYSPAERARLSSFVAQGGTLVVAAAEPSANELLGAVGTTIRVNGTAVRDEQSFDRSPALPRATDVANWTVLRGVDAVTLNYGTVLDTGRATSLVNTSVLAYLDTNRNGALDDNETLGAYPVVATESVGTGRVLVVSDSSIFTNAMLQRQGNRRFVQNLAADHEYLLLDYSQQDGFPPLSYTLLLVRTTPALQFLVGVFAVGAIAVVGRIRLYDRLQLISRAVDDSPRQTNAAPNEIDEITLSSFLRERHPDWDDQQVTRVTKAIIRQQRQSNDDD